MQEIFVSYILPRRSTTSYVTSTISWYIS